MTKHSNDTQHRFFIGQDHGSTGNLPITVSRYNCAASRISQAIRWLAYSIIKGELADKNYLHPKNKAKSKERVRNSIYIGQDPWTCLGRSNTSTERLKVQGIVDYVCTMVIRCVYKHSVQDIITSQSQHVVCSICPSNTILQYTSGIHATYYLKIYYMIG